MKTNIAAFLAAGAAALAQCAQAGQGVVTVKNTLDFDRTEVVEMPYKQAVSMAGANAIVAIDQAGRTAATQRTADGSKLLFLASVPANGEAQYTIAAAPDGFIPDTVACGKMYPYRQDDLAWENDLVGFRAYGPGTTKRGEKMYGYDLFLKRGTTKPVVESLYLAQNDPENWKIVNGLHAQGLHAKADSVQNSFTYHVDHGYGMDCYAVGATLGAGASAPIADGKLAFPGCFTRCKILENGPLRFSALLLYAPVAVGADSVIEARVITIDAGSHFVATEVAYIDCPDALPVGAGIAIHSQEAPEATTSSITYVDPTQGPDNGKVFIGLIMDKPGDTVGEIDGNMVITTTLKRDQSLKYDWGYGWDRSDVPTLEAWQQLMQQRKAAKTAPMLVSF